MKGIVLHFDEAKQNGIIRAEDGHRYGFIRMDYKSDRASVGDEVDFEVCDGVATEIYVLRMGAAGPLDMISLKRAISDGTSKVAEHISRSLPGVGLHSSHVSSDFTGSLSARMMSDWRNVLAVLAVLACFLPLVSFGPFSTNLFGLVSSAGLAKSQISALETIIAPPRPVSYNAWNMPAAPQAVVRPSAESAQLSTMSWLLNLAYLLYAIPALAAVTIVQVFRCRDTTRPALLLGLSCLALFPAAVAASSQMSSLKAQAPMFGMMPGIMGIIDLGFYALLAVGVGILLIQTGIVSAIPRRAQASVPA